VGGVPVDTGNGNENANVMKITAGETVESHSHNTGRSNPFLFSMQLGEIGTRSWRKTPGTPYDHIPEKGTPPLRGADLECRLTNDTA